MVCSRLAESQVAEQACFSRAGVIASYTTTPPALGGDFLFMSAAEIESTIESEWLDQNELSQNIESYLSFDQRIENEAHDLLDKQDRSEQRPEKFEAVVSSVDEVITREQFDAEQWTEIFDSSTRSEDSRLSRSVDNPAWNYTNESGEATSLTQSITEQADAIIASRHEEILQGLYSQGFAAVEYYDEMSQSIVKEFYFADEKGHISYKAFSKYEESPLADHLDENLEGDFEIVGSSIGDKETTEELNNIVAEPFQIDLTEFFATESQSYEQITDPVYAEQEQRPESFSLNLFTLEKVHEQERTLPDFQSNTIRHDTNLELRADHPAKESIINQNNNLKEAIFLTFEAVPNIRIEEAVFEQQTEQSTAETEDLIQESAIAVAKEIAPAQTVPIIEQSTNSIPNLEQSLNIEAAPAISLQFIEKSEQIQESIASSPSMKIAEVLASPTIGDLKESPSISIEPSETIISEKIANIQEPEKSLVEEREEFDDLEIVQTAIVPEAIAIKLEQSEPAQIVAISRPEQKNANIDVEIKSDAKEKVQAAVQSQIAKPMKTAPRIKLRSSKIEQTKAIDQAKNEVGHKQEALKVTERTGITLTTNNEASLNNREEQVKEVEQIVKIDQTAINTEKTEKSVPLYNSSNSELAGHDIVRPLYISRGRQSSQNIERNDDIHSAKPNRSTYNGEALIGRNQPSYVNDASQAETAEIYLDNDTGISLAPIKTEQLALAA